jgi:hypothetical protein
MHDRKLLKHIGKERTNLSQKQRRKDREETCLFVRKGRKTAPMKGQGRNLFICQGRKENGARERTGKKLVYLSGKEEKSNHERTWKKFVYLSGKEGKRRP